jgi:hypothetical protein
VSGAELFLAAAILITFCVIAGWSVGGRRRERFVAPPPSWWVCPACHSVNNADDELPLTCYRCRRVADPSTVERLETSPEFEWTQQLATTRKGGWEHDVRDMLADQTGTPQTVEPTAADPEVTTDQPATDGTHPPITTPPD